MTDLVERLRKWDRLHNPEGNIFTEAADEIERLSYQLVSIQERLRSPQMQAIGQEAIRKHPHYEGGPVSAYGFSGVALKAVADALSLPDETST